MFLNIQTVYKIHFNFLQTFFFSKWCLLINTYLFFYNFKKYKTVYNECDYIEKLNITNVVLNIITKKSSKLKFKVDVNRKISIKFYTFSYFKSVYVFYILFFSFSISQPNTVDSKTVNTD